MNLLFLAEVTTNEQWDFSLNNYNQVWSFLVQVGLLLIFLLLGNILRTVIPFFRKAMVPSALLGGTLLLIVDLIFTSFNIPLIDNRMMQVITYHGLGLGFAAMSLKLMKKTKAKTTQVFENGALQGGTYLLQAFVGLGITILLFVLTKNTSNPQSYISGVILPLAYGQGPGNALAWDINYTNMASTQFSGNGSYGLSLASIGFIAASLVGVVYINICKKRGTIKIRTEKKSTEHIDLTNPSGNEIPDNESVDKFSIQLGLVALAYAAAFGIMFLLAKIAELTNFNLLNSVAWGFNFMWAVIGATLIKLIINLCTKTKTMKRVYVNNYQMDRISGFFFDLMIVAGVAAIQISDVKKYILPVIILSVVGALVTFVYIKLVAKHCFKGFEHEVFLMSYGTLTGTASNGMILLKEVDPNLVTPTANLYVLSTFPAILFIAPLLLMLNFAGSSFKNAIIACGIFFILWVIYTIYLFRRKVFKNKYKNKPVEEWKEE